MCKAVFFFCTNPGRDHVAPALFDAVRQIYAPEEMDVIFDGKSVHRHTDSLGNDFLFVPTDEVVSHDYSRYAPLIDESFSDCDFAGICNWHEGLNAPDNILIVQTTGDMEDGIFGDVDPRHIRNLLLAIEQGRALACLDDFTTYLEGTHWSGKLYGGKSSQIGDIRVPMIDLEIGSSPSAWRNQQAVSVMAKALCHVFDHRDEDARSVLCVGGVHMEPTWANAVLGSTEGRALALSHVLPNHWLVSHGYDTEVGYQKLLACASSIIGGVDAIAFHEKLNADYKNQVRRLGEALGVPVYKHKRLRDLNSLELW